MADAKNAPSFPDVNSLTLSDDGTDYIYGGSIGINRILGYFQKNATSPYRTEWPLLLVNLYTVFRNCYNKDLSDLELDALVTQDCDLLTLYVASYAATRKHTYNLPGLIFYCPTYQLLPRDLLRTPSPADQVMNAAYERFRKGVGEKPVDVSQPNTAYRWVVPVGKTGYPHRQLNAWLDGNTHRFEYLPGRDKVLLISHCPIDLHLSTRIPTLHLMESYQGVVKAPTEFGSKIQADEHVPFNLYTHRVFGDKVHLAPMIKGAEKKALLAVAKEKNWMHHTASSILTDMTSTVPALTASELIRVKL